MRVYPGPGRPPHAALELRPEKATTGVFLKPKTLCEPGGESIKSVAAILVIMLLDWGPTRLNMRVDGVKSVMDTLSKAVTYLDSRVVKMLDMFGDAMRTRPDSIFRHVTTSIVLPCALVMTVLHDDPG